MKLIEDGSFPDYVRTSPECLFLPAQSDLETEISRLDLQAALQTLPADPEWVSVKTEMIGVADRVLSLAGLSGVLHPDTGPDDIILKPHDRVSARDPAVAEQFHHVDVAQDGFCGILLIGLEGSADSTPETQVVNNAAMVEYVDEVTRGGPLQERLGEIQVVRPFFNADHRDEWMDLPRHVLDRLRVQFRSSLTAGQIEHAERDTASIEDRSRFIGEVFISPLINESVMDGSPLVTCGVGSREIRLSLGSEQTDEEARALDALHDAVTRYLLDPTIEHGSERVVAGSAIFVPKDQLHKATPYLPHHQRSILGARCYANPGYTPPVSWSHASGQDY